ncbi:MAG: hypothetical protein AMJ60_01920 [Desulfobacterales bacterium SG8_35]|nr:MAG: hypothetical protein AMJ60_01920 [Desulfobacterales bacterium SG8_35]
MLKKETAEYFLHCGTSGMRLASLIVRAGVAKTVKLSKVQPIIYQGPLPGPEMRPEISQGGLSDVSEQGKHEEL